MTTSDADIRLARHVNAAAVMGRYHPWNLGMDSRYIIDQAEDRPIMLVERSDIDFVYEFSCHADHYKARWYYETQEYAEDWEPVALVNLDTMMVQRLYRTSSFEVESTTPFFEEERP